MDSLHMLLSGFGAAVSPLNLLVAALGAVIGTFVGVLPGLGPTSAIAILLPMTAVIAPDQGIIMMAGIYYGAMYGGSTTAILLNIPGETSSVPTCLDGYPLARQGKAGAALGVAAIASFAAGLIGLVGLTFFAPLLADQALKFGPPEYFALMILALAVTVNMTGYSLVKSLIMGALGFWVSFVGIGPSSGMPRFTFGIDAWAGGIEMTSVLIGLFALTEVFKGIEEKRAAVKQEKIGRSYPSMAELKQTSAPMLRGGLIGFVLGLLPGCSPTVTSFLAYDAEKKLSKNRTRFGQGAIEGVAAPEAANNATSSAGFIPLLALGIPASPPLAVLLAGLMIYGMEPGPLLFERSAGFVWTVIASMFIGNLFLLILNLPLVGLWAKLTKVPFQVMGPLILLISFVGSYSVRNSMFDVGVTLLFGALGYLFHKFHWPVIPFILCLVLGPMLETSFIQSVQISGGSLTIFLTHPISLAILIAAALLLSVSIVLMRRTKRRLRQEGAQELEIV